MSRPSTFGPLVRWELVRLARRGYVTRLRVLFLYTLFLGVIGFALAASYLDAHRNPFELLVGAADPLATATPPRFGARLAFTLLELQLLFVAAITPAYAAAAVSEEKDRRTFSMLLATQLTDREIVWGKAAGRALFILLTIAAGIPILLLTTLFGGVDAGLIAAGYALTAGTAILCTAIGMSAACRAPDSRSAIIRAYGETALLIGGVLLPPFVLFSPFAMLAYYYLQFETGALQIAFGFGYPAAQVAIAAVLLIEATRGLRNAGATEGPRQLTAYPEPPRGRPMPIVFTSITEYIPLPPIDDADPVLWKERHAGRTSPLPLFLDQPVRILGGLATIVAIALFVTGAYLLLQRIAGAFDPQEVDRLLQRGPGPPDAAGAYLVAAGVFATGLYLLPLAIGITGCVAGERIRGTLDPLLATPLRRPRMLRSKVLAHLERGLAFACGAAIALGAGFGIDGGTRLGLAAIAEFAAGVAFVMSLGAWLSVRCSSPLLALRLCIPAVVILVGLPVVVWNAIDWGNVALQVEVFSWTAIALVIGGIVCWWRAGVAIERSG